uniref:Putative secreted protein n=1 Tax=Anopheles darlingi TaxID=43151 RepID=A0A2M4DE71_ANODA
MSTTRNPGTSLSVSSTCSLFTTGACSDSTGTPTTDTTTRAVCERFGSPWSSARTNRSYSVSTSKVRAA